MAKINVKRIIMMMVLGIFVSGCAEIGVKDEPAQRADNVDFYQHWVNSYEEQTDGSLVFRPSGSREFPASRFRMEYVFNKNGSCRYKLLMPNDAHRMDSCVFTKVGNKVYLYDNSGALRPNLSFTISSVSKEILQATSGVKKPEVVGDKKSDASKEKGK